MRALPLSFASLAIAVCLSLAAPAANAQTSPTVTCPYTFLCVGMPWGGGDILSIDTSTAVAFGSASTAANDGWAFGTASKATGSYSIAWGQLASATGDYSLAFGNQSDAHGIGAIAMNGKALSDYSIAISGQAGFGSDPTFNTKAIAIGGTAFSSNTIAIGGTAYEANGTAVGTGSFAGSLANNGSAPNASAFGYQAMAEAANNVALGANTVNTEANTVAVGNRRITQVTAGTNPLDAVNVQQLNTAIAGIPAGGSAPVWLAATESVTPATVNGDNTAFRGAIAVGPGASAGNAVGGSYNAAFGTGAKAGLTSLVGGTTAVGPNANAQADNSSTFGAGATTGVDAVSSLAFGSYTNTDRANTAAFGNRTLSQVSAGTLDNDAVTLVQVQPQAFALGGGAGYNAGIFTAPTYSLSSGVPGSFNNVGDALTYLDTSMEAGWSSFDSWLGGGASSNGGTFYPPTYSLGGTDYHDVGSALTGLQTQITNIDTTGVPTPPPAWLASDDPNTAASVGGWDATAVGANAKAGIAGSSWGGNTAIGANSSAGTVANADGTSGQATAVGASAHADAPGSTVVGHGASTVLGADGSVVLGEYSTTDRAFTVAVGNRTVSQMANGTELQDGATINQINQVMAGFGGGASFLGGVYQAPTFILTAPGAAGTYDNTNDALLALDNGLNAVNTRVDNLPPPGTGGTGPQGPTGATGPQGPKGDRGQNGKDATGDNGTDALAVHYDGTAKDKVTLAGDGGTTISNVKAGVADDDAANVGQVSAQVQQAINTAKSYTDASSAQTLQSANNYTDWRVSQLNDRFSRTQALGTAQTQMVATFAGADPSAHNRIAAGTGFAGGTSAVSVGYQHVTNRGVAWNVGGAIAGRERTVGAGVGYSW